MKAKTRSMTLLALPILALAAACATGDGMTRAELRSSLNGLQEVPGPGDPDGSGTAVVRVNPAGRELCWTLNVRGTEPATAAHIHRGSAGVAGPPVATLTTPGADGRSDGCVAVDQPLGAEIANRPFDFYVNVHTAGFPAGAVRGQLRGEVGRLREGT
jgi:hypothetical protein